MNAINNNYFRLVRKIDSLKKNTLLRLFLIKLLR